MSERQHGSLLDLSGTVYPRRRSRPLVAVSLLLLRSLVGTRLGKRLLLSCQWAGPVCKSQITCNRCNKYVQTQNHWFPHRQRPISGTWVPSLVQMLTSQCRLHRNHPTYRIILLSCEICEASCRNLCLDELPPIRCWNNTNNTRCGKKPTTYRISGELSDRQ